MANYFNSLLECFIIAEIGVNHNGDVKLAKKMMMEAKVSGADAVKFQTFSAESLVTKNTQKVKYQQATTSNDESHYDMIKNLELNESEFEELFNYSGDIGIDFISTPYDINSTKFLNELGVKFFKTASADIVDLQLQEYIAKTGKRAIIATGMATLGEIETVVDIYEKCGNENLVLLHCVSNYPCSDESLNLKAIDVIKSAFDKPVGYSDHSIGTLASALSISLGAKVIEKHFTLNKGFPGPDHKASSTPDEFKALVKEIRRAECMLGVRKKKRQVEEQQMAEVSRKSIVYSRDLKAGCEINKEDLTVMRPGTGLPPYLLNDLIGLKLTKNVNSKILVKWGDIEE